MFSICRKLPPNQPPKPPAKKAITNAATTNNHAVVPVRLASEPASIKSCGLWPLITLPLATISQKNAALKLPIKKPRRLDPASRPVATPPSARPLAPKIIPPIVMNTTARSHCIKFRILYLPSPVSDYKRARLLPQNGFYRVIQKILAHLAVITWRLHHGFKLTLSSISSGGKSSGRSVKRMGKYFPASHSSI